MPESTYRSFVRTYLAITIGVFVMIPAANWAIDPLQFYRKASYRPILSENQRYQNPGLAKNYDYNAVIIGTSHTDNFSTKYIDQQLGCRTLKLSIRNSTSKEQRMILEKAITTGQVRHAIWGLDWASFCHGPAIVKEGFPHHLYNESPSTHFKYLFSVDTISLYWHAFGKDASRDLNALYNWHDEVSFGEKHVLAHWRSREFRIEAEGARDAAAPMDATSRSATENALQQNLFSVVRSHPNIRFYIFFPPHSIVYYRSLTDDLFERHLQFKRHVVEKMSPLEHCEVFDFQQQDAITHELANYRDMSHYREEINQYMVDCMHDGTHRVTADSARQERMALRNQRQSYKIPLQRL